MWSLLGQGGGGEQKIVSLCDDDQDGQSTHIWPKHLKNLLNQKSHDLES